MSFALTVRHVINRSKTVTWRVGWSWLQPGTLLQPVLKAQGLKKGERVTKIGPPIRVLSVTPERLDALRYQPLEVQRAELAREGVSRTCDTWQDFMTRYFHSQGVKVDQVLTRIEFEYLPVGDSRWACPWPRRP